MNQTITAVGIFEPFDIRRCPIWAIPQILHLTRHIYGCKIEMFVQHRDTIGYPNSAGTVYLRIPGEGLYKAYIYKENMRAYDSLNRNRFPCIPALYPALG